jgi:hypothetical protein
MNRKFSISLLAMLTTILSFGYGQNQSGKNAGPFFDSVDINHKLTFVTKFQMERNVKKESVIVSKNKQGEYFAKIKNDSLSKTIKLTADKIQRLKAYENEVRDGLLKSNSNHYLPYASVEGCGAEYEVSYGTKKVTFSSKTIYNSLIQDILK